MTLKALVSGAAAAVVIAGAAAGVTSIASSDVTASPRVAPVVWDIPMPEAPAPDLQGPLLQTLQALGGPGSSAGKAPYIQGGIGRIEGRVADTKLREAQAEGKFPLSFSLANIDQNGRMEESQTYAGAVTSSSIRPIARADLDIHYARLITQSPDAK